MNTQADINAVNGACEHHQCYMSAEAIRQFTDKAVASPLRVLADVHRAWNSEHCDHPEMLMSYSVAAKYISWFRENGVYFEPEKRGPK